MALTMGKRVFCILILGILAIFFTEDATARAQRIPGLEMVGTWKIVGYDLSEFPQPVSQETMDGLVRKQYFLPLGQLIEITFDESYTESPRREVLAQYNFRTVSSISDEICRFGIWKKAICKNGKVPASTTFDHYFSCRLASHKPRHPLAYIIGDNKMRRARWPDASPYEYAMIGDHDVYKIRILKDGRLLVMFRGGPADSIYYEGPEKGEAYMESINTVYMIWERVKSPEKKE